MTRKEMLAFIAANTPANVQQTEAPMSTWRTKLLDMEDKSIRAQEDALAYREVLRLRRLADGYTK